MDEDEVLKQYLTEISKCIALTSDEELELLRLVAEAQQAERRLIESNLALVVNIAERYKSSGMPMFHLIQEGNLGLMTAVRRFAESKKGNFREYVTELIEKTIQLGVSEHKRGAGEDPR